ncbi:MAG: hypothetical protein D6B25_13575 [Desulfobulbaceae bacterium]|nr:MAG: hypothetical protein D6B25_13575 [Desulfobulbaceae bacterium]
MPQLLAQNSCYNQCFYRSGNPPCIIKMPDTTDYSTFLLLLPVVKDSGKSYLEIEGKGSRYDKTV